MLALVVFSPPEGLGLIGCPIRAATGVPCPGCGITRSMTLLTRGDIGASLATHPFGIAMLALLVGIAITALCSVALPRRVRARIGRSVRPFVPVGRLALLGLCVAMGAWGIWRAITSR